MMCILYIYSSQTFLFLELQKSFHWRGIESPVLLESNCSTLLVQLSLISALLNKNKEVVGENNDVEPTMLNNLAPDFNVLFVSSVFIPRAIRTRAANLPHARRRRDNC